MPDSTPGFRAMAAVGLFVAVALLLPALSPFDPLAITLENKLSAPSTVHWLGTDDLGRDLLSRLLVGATTTVLISFLTLFVSTLFAVVVGALVGFSRGGWPDTLFSWVAGYLSSLPALLVIAAVLTALGPSLWKAYFVLALLLWVAPARVMRAQVMQVASLDYVAASRLNGASTWRILTRTIIPNCTGPVAIFSLSYLPEVVALEAGISFLGLGVQPPQPSLGRMIFDGVGYLYSAWWMAVFPGLFLTAIILIANSVARTVGAGFIASKV